MKVFYSIPVKTESDGVPPKKFKSKRHEFTAPEASPLEIVTLKSALPSVLLRGVLLFFASLLILRLAVNILPTNNQGMTFLMSAFNIIGREIDEVFRFLGFVMRPDQITGLAKLLFYEGLYFFLCLLSLSPALKKKANQKAQALQVLQDRSADGERSFINGMDIDSILMEPTLLSLRDFRKYYRIVKEQQYEDYERTMKNYYEKKKQPYSDDLPKFIKH